MTHHISPISKKFVLIIFLVQCCFLPAQETIGGAKSNVVSYEYIDGCIFITFSIVNYNPHSIFIIKRYHSANIKIEKNILFLTLESSWPPEKFYEMDYYPSHLFHIREDCQDIRSGQTVSLSLLLRINENIRNDMPIKVYGLRYVNNFNFLSDIKNKNNLKEIYDVFVENIIYIDCELMQSFLPGLLGNAGMTDTKLEEERQEQ